MLALCVLLWSAEGREDDLADYEDRVLALLPAHGGRLISRVRAVEGGPTEVHVLEFPSEEALSAFSADPAREALSALREHVVRRAEVLRVEVVQAHSPGTA